MTCSDQKRPFTDKAESSIGRTSKVLSGKGFITLVDYLGTDSSVVRAARTSYGEVNKTVEDDQRLIRFLMRNKHTSPFEQVSFIFRIRLPYTLSDELANCRASKCYITWPKCASAIHFWRPKKTPNEKAIALEQQVIKIFSEMEKVEKDPVLLRCFLPGSVFVDMVWKVDLHNLCFFIARCLLSKIEGLSEYMEELIHYVQAVAPVCFDAFKNYLVDEKKISRQGCLELKEKTKCLDSAIIENMAREAGMSLGEVKEFLQKIK